MTYPPSPKELQDGLESVDINQGGTQVKQVDEALHPDGSNFVELLLKTRIDPEAQQHMDHLISDAIQNGNIDIPLFNGKTPNAVEALTVAHIMTQYAINGQARMEFARILAGLGNFVTAPFRSLNRKRSNYGEQSGGGFG